MSPLQRFTSKSGVSIASEFRDNLIIDRYDPVFATMRASKLKHMCSENSEDVVTWNAFTSMKQVDPSVWLPELARLGLPDGVTLSTSRVCVRLWLDVSPPASLLEMGDEGVSEIDIAIESPEWVWFIEAKYKSDISSRTTTRPERDQLLRNIDVGSYYAGVRNFYFSLLILSHKRSPKGVEAIERYRDIDIARSSLAEHRRDGLKNLRAISLMSWQDICATLEACGKNAVHADEMAVARRAADWMRSKGLCPRLA